MLDLSAYKIKNGTRRSVNKKISKSIIKNVRPGYHSFISGNPPRGRSFKFVSLFSGAGIGDFGLTLSGGKCLGASEIDGHRRAVHSQNIGVPLWGDICSAADEIISTFQGLDLDILVATPPCQSFSSANAKRGRRSDPVHAKKDGRNRLFFEAIKIARGIKPKVIVFENVPNFLERAIENEMAPGKVGRVGELIDQLLDGYVGASRIFCFSEVGVPQRRKRALSIFVRGDLLKDPLEVSRLLDLSHWKGSFSRGPKTVRSALQRMKRLDGALGGHRESDPNDLLHSVPTYGARHYAWISSIPQMTGLSAWQNNCIE